MPSTSSQGDWRTAAPERSRSRARLGEGRRVAGSRAGARPRRRATPRLPARDPACGRGLEAHFGSPIHVESWHVAGGTARIRQPSGCGTCHGRPHNEEECNRRGSAACREPELNWGGARPVTAMPPSVVARSAGIRSVPLVSGVGSGIRSSATPARAGSWPRAWVSGSSSTRRPPGPRCKKSQPHGIAAGGAG